MDQQHRPHNATTFWLRVIAAVLVLMLAKDIVDDLWTGYRVWQAENTIRQILKD
jgi:hypothetical protein